MKPWSGQVTDTEILIMNYITGVKATISYDSPLKIIIMAPFGTLKGCY